MTVVDDSGRFLANAYFNGLSQISLRILSRQENERIDETFIINRLTAALNRRKNLFDFEHVTIMRLFNSESDFLPGLIVDRYDDFIVLQSLTAGAEKFIEIAVRFYEKELKCRAVLIKNDSPVRKLEGLELYSALRGNASGGPRVVLSEGIYYIIDPEKGQKTGFFADQRRAYESLKGRVSGRAMLDCFSYSGAFSMNAFKYGASHAVIVDISSGAIDLARQTAELNGVGAKCEFICANAFDYLKTESMKYKGNLNNQQPFDFIVLDPPAFAKSKSSVPEALRGYKELALRAARLVKNGGYILNCSCSFHVRMNEFYDAVCGAFSDANVTGYLQNSGFQDERDHPVISSMPESLYLKYFLFSINR